MTQLSPEAQAVLDATDYPEDWATRIRVAAAIGELLEQVLPASRPQHPNTLDERHRKVDAWAVRSQVLRLVAELETL